MDFVYQRQSSYRRRMQKYIDMYKNLECIEK